MNFRIENVTAAEILYLVEIPPDAHCERELGKSAVYAGKQAFITTRKVEQTR